MNRYTRYPLNLEDYALYEAIGEGGSAIIRRALCVPFNEIVAIKVLDLEKCNDLDDIRREVQIMSLIEHPTILRGLCSFTNGYNLCVVMPYMDGGSCLNLMKLYYEHGFKENVIKIFMHEALIALHYLHVNGYIHRDIKAGNILLDSNGNIKLTDFGISTCVFDTGDGHRLENTFRGTPCWMAPEVLFQEPLYDFKIDIWSFGITALELAHGHAPYWKLPLEKIMLMIKTQSSPSLSYERDKKFSKNFGQMIAACLAKDPTKRPTANALMNHSFFRKTVADVFSLWSESKTDYLVRKLKLKELPPLGERNVKLKEKEAALLQANKIFQVKDKPSSSKQQNERCEDVSCLISPIKEIWHPNEMQKDKIKKLMSCVKQSSGNPIELTSVVGGHELLDLQNQITHLEQAIGSLEARLETQKLINEEMERQLIDIGRN